MAIYGNTVVVDCRATGNTFQDKQIFSYAGDVDANSVISSASTPGAINVTNGGIIAAGGIKGDRVYNAIWNDLADSIPVNEDVELVAGKAYCFDGEKYFESTEYMADGYIGIHSDTYGMNMGSKEGIKQLDCAVAGFVLAYVDKEYPVGTPLTCTKDGKLTAIKKRDKIRNPEKIVATYWKSESNNVWGPEGKEVFVNGRKWVKVR